MVEGERVGVTQMQSCSSQEQEQQEQLLLVYDVRQNVRLVPPVSQILELFLAQTRPVRLGQGNILAEQDLDLHDSAKKKSMHVCKKSQ